MKALTAITISLGCVILASCATSSQKSTRAAETSAPRSTRTSELQPDAGFLAQYAATNRFRLGKPTSITVVPGGETVLFLRSGPRSFAQDLYEFDLATGQERLALSSERLLGGAEEKLTVEELARRERMRMASRGITSYSLSEDGSQLLIPLSGRLFIVQRSDGAIRELPSDGGFPIDARFSKDGTKVACARDGDLYVIDVASSAQTRLTTDAGGPITNALAEFVAQEEMSRTQGYWWSPDAAFIAYQRNDTTGMEQFHIADAFRPENAPTEWAYPRAGRKNAEVKLGVIPVTGGSTTWITWDHERYPYLATIRWASERSGDQRRNGPLLALVQNRAQTEELLLEIDTATGSTRTLLTERDSAWINLFQKAPRWLKDGSGFLWLTERNGHIELELRNRDGSFARTIAGESIGLDDLIAVDDREEFAYVIASPHPTQKHVWRVPLAASGGAPQRLTSEPGNHSLTLAEDGSAYVEYSTTHSGRESWTVKRANGSRAGELKSLAEKPSFEPRVELVTVRAGGRELHAAVVRPRGFQYGQKYPVIASVYGGPHSQVVTSARNAYFLNQWIADHGYIVVSVDGRGTPARGRDWERSIKGNLVDPALEDLVGGVTALGNRFSEMDMQRVGIFGWSFGGYFSAMAAMRRPDIFKAGVAGAPVADWRDYDTHYTERYMGHPDEVPGAYDNSSVLTYCKDLSVPLLIIHGTADDNVYLIHGLRMSDALFRAGKPFEFLPLAGATHMVREPEAIDRMYSRIITFFDRALADINHIQ